MAVQNTKSYYEILGVGKTATDKDIRQAYRRLARKYHPDLNPGDASAEAKFKEINQANEVLSDAESRKKYDRYGDDWKRADEIESRGGPGGSGGAGTWRGGDFDYDLFDGFDDLIGGFGHRGEERPPSPQRLELDIEVSLEEAYLGSKRTVTITQGGRDRRIEVDIPQGVDTGSVVKVTPAADQDLRMKITVAQHPRFQRSGSDLYLDVAAPIDDAALGGDVEVATMNGKVQLKLPAGSQNGQRIRLKGKGMPKLGEPGEKGDLFVVVRPRLPERIGEGEREAFERLRRLRTGRR